MKRAVVLPLFLVCSFITVLGVGELAAGGAEDTFAGKVLILAKRPPSYFSSAAAFVQFLRSNSTQSVGEGQDRKWTFETMTFLRKPLGDYEISMTFFDVTNGKGKDQRRFVNSYPQYTQDRNTRALSGKTVLPRPDFDANVRYLVIAEAHGQELARGEFTTRGTSQATLDQQKRLENEQRAMEESMRELERKAKEQEEREKAAEQKQNQKQANDLF